MVRGLDPVLAACRSSAITTSGSSVGSSGRHSPTSDRKVDNLSATANSMSRPVDLNEEQPTHGPTEHSHERLPGMFAGLGDGVVEEVGTQTPGE